MKKVAFGIVLFFSVQILIGQVTQTVTFDYTTLTQTSKDDWVRFNYPNAVIYTNPGEPELQAIAVNLIVRSGESVSVCESSLEFSMNNSCRKGAFIQFWLSLSFLYVFSGYRLSTPEINFI